MLVEDMFDINTVSYGYTFKDPRVKRVVDTLSTWSAPTYPLSVAIQGIARADSVNRKGMSRNALRLHKYLLGLRKLELELLKELIKIEEGEKAEKILFFNNSRLQLVRNLRVDLVNGAVQDPSQDGILLREIDRILGVLSKSSLVITIDGLSGAGKSSMAQEVARRIGAVYFSYGKVYRLIAWLALKNKIRLGAKIQPRQVDELIKIAESIDLGQFASGYIGDTLHYFYRDQDIIK